METAVPTDAPSQDWRVIVAQDVVLGAVVCVLIWAGNFDIAKDIMVGGATLGGLGVRSWLKLR